MAFLRNICAVKIKLLAKSQANVFCLSETWWCISSCQSTFPFAVLTSPVTPCFCQLWEERCFWPYSVCVLHQDTASDPQHSREGGGTLSLSARWLLADLLWTKPHLAQTLTQPRLAGSSCPTPPSRGVCPSWTQSTLDTWAGEEQELCASHSVSGTAS